MFLPGCPGNSEIDAVKFAIKTLGMQGTKEKWEAHWSGTVSDVDLEWFVREARGTSIRLPIGYYILGLHFVKGTQYAGVAKVYENSWKAVKEFVLRARKYGIGVLLDLHALPGGANKDQHSGSGTGRAEFWQDRKNLELGTKCALFLAHEVSSGMDGIVGIQLCNEAIWDAPGMYEWYSDVMKAVSRIDASIPIYISDAWNLSKALQWTNAKAKGDWTGNPIVVDTHKYYTFSDSDRSKTPTELIHRVNSELQELEGKSGDLSARGEAQIIVGEYSCVLDGKTWAKVSASEKESYIRRFGEAQSDKWRSGSGSGCGGSYFWTWKMEWMDGGEWGFVEQVKKQNIVAPEFLMFSGDEVRRMTQEADGRKEGLKIESQQGHENYWSSRAPDVKLGFALFGEGWGQGWEDARSFWVMKSAGTLGIAASGGDKIGCLEIWVKKRLSEAGSRIRGVSMWQWEHGFRAGVKAWERLAGQ